MVGCTAGFAGLLLFRMVMRRGLADASAVYIGEVTTSPRVFVSVFLLEVMTSGDLLRRFRVGFLAPAFLLTVNVVNAVRLLKRFCYLLLLPLCGHIVFLP